MAKSRRARMAARARKLSKARASTHKLLEVETSGLIVRNRTSTESSVESDAAATADAPAVLATPDSTPLLAHSAFRTPSPTTTHIATPGTFDVLLSVSDDAGAQASDSPFNPKVYKCSGYSDESWEWFDGTPGSDSRFTIDIENGSTDGLRDVRPYLYLLGFWTPLSAQQRRTLEKDDPMMVEEAYVKLGRAYLVKEREKGRGYFLARRNWSEYNHGSNIGWPCQEFAGCEPEDGDVGFEMIHESEDFPNDVRYGVVKTNIRSPLPKEHLVTVRPEDPKWDDFIRWIYKAAIHGAMWATHGCRRKGWLKEEALDGWGAF